MPCPSPVYRYGGAIPKPGIMKMTQTPGAKRTSAGRGTARATSPYPIPTATDTSPPVFITAISTHPTHADLRRRPCMG